MDIREAAKLKTYSDHLLQISRSERLELAMRIAVAHTRFNPFSAHSQSVLEAFAGGSHGDGPWITGPHGPVWGTREDAEVEVRARKNARNAAARARRAASKG